MKIGHKNKSSLEDKDPKRKVVYEDLDLEQTAKEADQNIRRKRREAFVQSVGLAAFLFGIITAALITGWAEGERTLAYLVMFFVTCVGIWMASYRFRYIAVIVGGLQTLVYTIYQLYESIGNHREILLMDYAWLVLPILCISSMVLFMLNMFRMEKMTEMLEDQIQNLEVIDPVTGLSNLKSMYMDLERQMTYARRKDIELTLIILELRYYRELKAIMANRQLSDLKRRMGGLVEDLLRMEDRVYSIDDKGSLGIVCIGCGKDDASIVRKRITDAFNQKDSFEGILDRKLKVDIVMGIYAYDKEEIKNAMEFKRKAENELQYDV